MKRGPRDLKGFFKDKKRVFSLVLKTYNRVNSTKRSKRTAYKKLKILKNCKVSIGTPPVYYIWGL